MPKLHMLAIAVFVVLIAGMFIAAILNGTWLHWLFLASGCALGGYVGARWRDNRRRV